MSTVPDTGFAEIVDLIVATRQRAVQTVNAALIDLYWQVGAIIGRKIAAAEWGDGVVAQLAEHIARTQLGLRGFTRRNLFRMRQFHDAYLVEFLDLPEAHSDPRNLDHMASSSRASAYCGIPD